MHRFSIPHPLSFGCALLLAGAAASHLSAQTTVSADNQEPVSLSVFEVSTTRDNGYKASNAVGATRTNTPISDTPQNIEVFNSLFIDDTLSFNLTDLTYFDPSFTPTQPDKGTYLSRGFTVNATYVDGMPQRNTFGPNYTANVERVEILKGPSAILYGSGQGGATINRVLKRALPVARTTVLATAGSNDLKRVSLDTMAPLGFEVAGRKAAYRINFAWQDGHTFKTLSKNREVLISPTVTIPLGPKTDVALEFTYDKTNLSGNFADPVMGGVPGQVILPGGGTVHVPIQNSFGEPFDQRPIAKTLTSYDLRHSFNEHLSFRSQYQYETYTQRDKEIFPQIGQYVLTATTASIKRAYREQNVDYKADRMRNELVAAFDTGPVKHQLLAGFAFDETNEYQLYHQTTTAAVPPIDMVNPVYGQYAQPDIATVPVATDQQTKSLDRAWYVNELASLFDDRLFLQLGYRSQDTYQRVNNHKTKSVSAIPTSANTSSFGAVFHLNQAKTLSLWGDVSEAFEPNFRVNPDGSTLPATTGKTQEGGLKFDMMQHTLSGTLSVFHTVRFGVPISAPDLGDGYYRPGPGQTSQGFEIDASYNPSRRFQINGGYAYLDAHDTATGVNLTNAPKNSLSLFARYEQPEGLLKGAFFTVGWIYRGTRDPQSATSQPYWQVPEFKRLDFGAGYGWKRDKIDYRISCNVTNATDELLFGDNNLYDRYAMLSPREVRLSFRAKF